MYKCEICGKEHRSIMDRAKCELDCAKRIEEEAKKAAEAKKKEEQKVREAEVNQAIDNTAKLLNQYITDYGFFKYNGKSEDIQDLVLSDVIPTKLRHHFFF